jgi:transposase
MDNFGETLRAYVRRRRNVIQDRNRHVNRMHKVLVLMNVQIGTQLTDLGGASGMDIVRDIVAGQRDPKKLVAHVRKGVKASQEELLKALQGTWQPAYIFELKQLLQFYDMATQQMKGCDREIELLLEHWCTENDVVPPDPKTPPKGNEKKATDGKNLPPLRVTRMINQMVGPNLLDIGGVNGGVMLDIIAETGSALHQFPSAAHYTSLLGLAPNNKVSGGKRLSSKTPKRCNRAAFAFKQVANSIGRAKQHPLKPFFHAIQKRKGWNAAVTATARKLAAIYHKIVTENLEFDYPVTQLSEEQRKQAILKKIQKSVNELNLKPEDIFTEAA